MPRRPDFDFRNPRLWAGLAIAAGAGLCALALAAQASAVVGTAGGIRFTHFLFG